MVSMSMAGSFQCDSTTWVRTGQPAAGPCPTPADASLPPAGTQAENRSEKSKVRRLFAKRQIFDTLIISQTNYQESAWQRHSADPRGETDSRGDAAFHRTLRRLSASLAGRAGASSRCHEPSRRYASELESVPRSWDIVGWRGVLDPGPTLTRSANGRNGRGKPGSEARFRSLVMVRAG